MKSFQCKKPSGEIYGLIVDPSQGEYIPEKSSKILLEYVKSIFSNDSNEDEKIFIENLVPNDKGFYTSNTYNDNILQNFLLKLNKKITEQVIVPQDMGNGPYINHRVFYFKKNQDNNIEIKFTELGDFNSLDYALEYISNLYSLNTNSK